MQPFKLFKKIAEGKSDFKSILIRIKNRDFSGNTGQAIRNSVFQFLTQITQRVGSLILTIILARMLMPELFGLYNLALSTIMVFVTFSELGVGTTLITFVSKSLGKKNKKLARSYFIYLGKIKFFLVFLSTMILLLSARFIANNYYQKPIFLALIAGSLYILFSGFVNFFQSSLQSFNYFKGIFNNEIVFEISRIILIPLAAILTLKYSLSNENILFYIFIAFGVSYLISSLFILFFPYRKINPLPNQKKNLGSVEKKQINKFFLAASTLTLSGIFFGYIDKIMLGHFVAAEFIGYYSAAFSLVGALSTVIGFGIVLLPIFSRINSEQLERGMNKSIKVTLIISALAFLAVLALAYPIIFIVYGSAYNYSINMLRAFSISLLIFPLMGVYTVYFMSKGKLQILAVLLFISTLINLGLTYFLITYLLRFGELTATYGAIIAVIVSNLFYLLGMMIWRKRK